MTLTPWSHGKSLLWDVTIRDTLAPSYIHESSKHSGSVADNAERAKNNHYLKLKENYLFTPIAFETIGSMGPDTKEFIKKLGNMMKRSTGEAKSKYYVHSRKNICVKSYYIILTQIFFRGCTFGLIFVFICQTHIVTHNLLSSKEINMIFFEFYFDKSFSQLIPI